MNCGDCAASTATSIDQSKAGTQPYEKKTEPAVDTSSRQTVSSKSRTARSHNANAPAHANFRKLKIKNKNSKAKGRGKFGRRK